MSEQPYAFTESAAKRTATVVRQVEGTAPPHSRARLDNRYFDTFNFELYDFMWDLDQYDLKVRAGRIRLYGASPGAWAVPARDFVTSDFSPPRWLTAVVKNDGSERTLELLDAEPPTKDGDYFFFVIAKFKARTDWMTGIVALWEEDEIWHTGSFTHSPQGTADIPTPLFQYQVMLANYDGPDLVWTSDWPRWHN